MADLVLVNPPNITQKGDWLGSGIVYMPHGLAGLAGVLRKEGLEFRVIDSFGENPNQIYDLPSCWVQGLSLEEIASRVGNDCRAVIIYVASIHQNLIVRRTAAFLKNRFPSLKIGLTENTQAVISYSLAFAANDFFRSGVDFIITGEPEVHGCEVLKKVLRGEAPPPLEGVLTSTTDPFPKGQTRHPEVADLNALPFMAWDLFPLKNYWDLGYGHGPFQKPYLALLTSRGCPFQCSFCSIPVLNRRSWRSQSPQRVVDEMVHWKKYLGVEEFHLEDVNPGVDRKRVVKIAALLNALNDSIIWKWPSGTKIDTLEIEDLENLRKGGLTYLSFSPETGSDRLLRLMNKKFDHGRALSMVRECRRLGIVNQACFVLGYPGENNLDRVQTEDYVKNLVRAGVDEVAFFIATPMPGTPISKQLKGYKELSQLTFSPTWRDDFRELCRWRKRLYRVFVKSMLTNYPVEVMKSGFRLVRGRSSTKAEMNLKRFRHMVWLTTFKRMKTVDVGIGAENIEAVKNNGS